jgi:hypothetical protein
MYPHFSRLDYAKPYAALRETRQVKGIVLLNKSVMFVRFVLAPSLAKFRHKQVNPSWRNWVSKIEKGIMLWCINCITSVTVKPLKYSLHNACGNVTHGMLKVTSSS